MPLTPAQIKDKLTNALDDDKNVIDEKAVEEVITLLEASTITKEILEQTRLGRDINLVRKTSKNPVIAKRAKELVKAWKKLIVVPGSPQVANGQHPVQRISPGQSPASSRCSTPVKCLPSPALVHVRQQQNLKGGGAHSPLVQGRLGQRPLPPSRLAQHDAKTKGGSLKSPKAIAGNQQLLLRHTSISYNEDSNLSWPGTPPSNVSESSQDRLISDRENQEAQAGDKAAPGGSNKRNFHFDNKQLDHSTESTSKSVNRASDQRDVSKTNVANRKRTRSSYIEDSNDSFPDPPSKHPRFVSSSPSLSTFSKNDVINGSSVRKMGGVRSPGFSASDAIVCSGAEHKTTTTFPSRTHQRLTPLRQDSVDSRLSVQSSDSRGIKERLSKVKTTEQLIEDMQRKSATPVGTSVIAQIRTNQIQKESDYLKNSLPPSTKRRGRTKKLDNELELPDTESPSDGRRLAQAKSEYIERFLQTSVAPTPGEDAFEQPISHLRQESLEEHPLALGGCSSTFAQAAYEASFHSYSSRQDKPDSGPSASPPDARDIIEAPGHLPSTATSAFQENNVSALDHMSVEQILARLPPVHFDTIDWTSHDYPAPQPVQVSESLVQQLHHETLDGINGTYDRDGQFKRWHEMLTMDSIYDEPLCILPYVIPND